MLIESIDIKRFRSIRDVTLGFHTLTVIVGRNGSGKSSVLHALQNFYQTAAATSVEDFFNRDTDQPIELRVTFSRLTSAESAEFAAFIQDGKVSVLKRIDHLNGQFSQRYYGTVRQIRQFAEIRAIPSKPERRKKWDQLVASSALPDLPGKARSAGQVDVYMDEHERSHPELLEPIEMPEQFFGDPNVGGGKLDKYTRFVVLPAVREVSDEVVGKRGTSLYELLDLIVLRRVNARDDIQSFRAEVESRARQLFSSENLTELGHLGSEIPATLAKWAPGAEFNLKWSEYKALNIPLPEAAATLVEDGFEGDISRKGHGLQRALIVSLLQQLALATVGTAASGAEGSPESVEQAVAVTQELGPDLILAIEEPELYLHPQRCRYLSSLLLNLAATGGTSGGRNQIIYTTHSPYFVDLARFDQIRRLQNVRTGASPPDTTAYSFTRADWAQKLAEISDRPHTEFTAESVVVRSASTMNSIVNEGFFADAVAVVEGQSDAALLWQVQEMRAAHWDERGIAVVPAFGKENIDRLVVVFRGLSLPTYFVFDADSRFIGKKEQEQIAPRNRHCLRLAGARECDFPDTGVYDRWAAFNNDIETEIQAALGTDVFLALRDEVAQEVGHDAPSQLLKSPIGASAFIKRVYDKGLSVPTLEQVVDAVTAIAPAIAASPASQ